MEEEPKRYVSLYVKESIANQLEAIDKGDWGNFVEEYIEESKRDLKVSMDYMDDEIIEYKAAMINARKKFKEAKEEMLEANYAMWEEFDNQKKNIQSKAEEMVKELGPLKGELNRIAILMHGIDTFKIERFLEILEKIKNHLYGEDRNILEFLLKNYQREE